MKHRIPEGGFTLIELLAVVLILGVLAVITFPMLTSQLDRARVAALESELRNAAAAQAALTISQGSPTDNLSDLVAEGLRASPEVTFTNDGSFTAHPSGMCMQVEHSLMPGESWAFAATGGANPYKGTC